MIWGVTSSFQKILSLRTTSLTGHQTRRTHFESQFLQRVNVVVAIRAEPTTLPLQHLKTKSKTPLRRYDFGNILSSIQSVLWPRKIKLQCNSPRTQGESGTTIPGSVVRCLNFLPFTSYLYKQLVAGASQTRRSEPQYFSHQDNDSKGNRWHPKNEHG